MNIKWRSVLPGLSLTAARACRVYVNARPRNLSKVINDDTPLSVISNNAIHGVHVHNDFNPRVTRGLIRTVL